MNKILVWLISIIALGIIGFFVFFLGWVSYIDNYEFGYTFDRTTGKIDSLDKRGYVITPLLTRVYTFDTRPIKIVIFPNSRILNAKLVKFNTNGYKEFIEWHGVDNYSSSQLENLLGGYAFDPSDTKYPFLTILKELKNDPKNIPISQKDTIN